MEFPFSLVDLLSRLKVMDKVTCIEDLLLLGSKNYYGNEPLTVMNECINRLYLIAIIGS